MGESSLERNPVVYRRWLLNMIEGEVAAWEGWLSEEGGDVCVPEDHAGVLLRLLKNLRPIVEESLARAEGRKEG